MEKLEIHFSILYVKYFLTFYLKKSSLSTLLLSPECTKNTKLVVELKGKFIVHTSATLVMMS